MLAEPVAALIVALAAPYDAILAPSTSTGRNIMPRVAALLDVMQISDASRVLSPDTFERPIYAGNVLETVRATDAKTVITALRAMLASPNNALLFYRFPTVKPTSSATAY